ncbi:hypothetical protein AX14_010129 [Amanita brunnescens Koide BX004]|nr:hypothetical protein AX14_002598 [Amanita brunnescens Koide BX004]KAF8721894.1 hypothetical protein AX14_010129 [Amanita brunnescens Koide BX004]
MSNGTNYTIPSTQKAAIVQSLGASITVVQDHPVPNPDSLKPGECLVKLHSTGVCHTDLHAASGDWPDKPKLPLISGHEGVGDIVAIGRDTVHSPVKIGQRVGIKWLAYSCLDCEMCRKGLEQACPEAKLSGFTVDGTFSEYVVSWVHHVTPIPDSLESCAAASILCAGVTVYRALKYSETNPGDWIVLPGAGGGLGHLAVQYARYMGRRVIAIDTGEEKRQLCKDLGADHWIDFNESKDIVQDIKAATDGLGAHSTLITAASGAAYAQAIGYIRPGGTLMAVSLPGKATLDASIYHTVTKSLKIIGSYVGNRQDAIEAMNIAAISQVKCHYAEKLLADIKKVYDEMKEGKIAGRIVINYQK